MNVSRCILVPVNILRVCTVLWLLHDRCTIWTVFSSFPWQHFIRLAIYTRYVLYFVNYLSRISLEDYNNHCFWCAIKYTYDLKLSQRALCTPAICPSLIYSTFSGTLCIITFSRHDWSIPHLTEFPPILHCTKVDDSLPPKINNIQLVSASPDPRSGKIRSSVESISHRGV